MTGESGKFELAKGQESVKLSQLVRFMEVHPIDLQFQGRSSLIASFLVRSGEGAFLIETGPESTREVLVASLAKFGVSPGELKGVFVTHIHLDHAGAAGWFAREGVPVYVHPRGAAHLADPSRLVESARRVYGERFDSLWGVMIPAPESCVIPLTDGESVNVAGMSVTALETPGHAFHHHAYLVEGQIFAGDAAGARLPGDDYISVTAAPPQFHLEHTLASLGKLAAVGADRLYLTHFGEVLDAPSHLASYRDTVELNAEFVRQRLLEGFDAESLVVAYEAFQLEQAFRLRLAPASWEKYQLVNGAAMCADGIRMFWQKRFAEES